MDALQITIAEPNGTSTRLTRAGVAGSWIPPRPSIEKEEMDRIEGGETEGRISWGLWSPKVGPGDTDAIRRRAT
jgi:hypothetical protein